MERRSENEQSEIRKIADIETTRKTVFLGFCMYAFFMVIFAVLIIELKREFNPYFIISVLIITWIFVAVMAILVGIFIIYPNQIEKETKKRSVVFVANSLPKDYRIEVIPVQAPLRYYMFLTKEMPSLGNFYAKLKDDSYVTIEFKLKNDSSYHFVENIEKEKFTYYYKLKTETEK